MLTERYSKEQLIFQGLLKNLRIEHSLTQRELAKKLNVHQSLVSKYESGERHISFIELTIICSALDVSISDFLALYEKSILNNESKQ